MKKTLKNHIDVVADFEQLMLEKPSISDFEDVLPHKKIDILFAILTILKTDSIILEKLLKQSKGEIKLYKEDLIEAAILLVVEFIPSEEQYQVMVNRKNLLDEPKHNTEVIDLTEERKGMTFQFGGMKKPSEDKDD